MWQKCEQSRIRYRFFDEFSVDTSILNAAGEVLHEAGTTLKNVTIYEGKGDQHRKAFFVTEYDAAVSVGMYKGRAKSSGQLKRQLAIDELGMNNGQGAVDAAETLQQQAQGDRSHKLLMNKFNRALRILSSTTAALGGSHVANTNYNHTPLAQGASMMYCDGPPGGQLGMFLPPLGPQQPSMQPALHQQRMNALCAQDGPPLADEDMGMQTATSILPAEAHPNPAAPPPAHLSSNSDSLERVASLSEGMAHGPPRLDKAVDSIFRVSAQEVTNTPMLCSTQTRLPHDALTQANEPAFTQPAGPRLALTTPFSSMLPPHSYELPQPESSAVASLDILLTSTSTSGRCGSAAQHNSSDACRTDVSSSGLHGRSAIVGSRTNNAQRVPSEPAHHSLHQDTDMGEPDPQSSMGRPGAHTSAAPPAGRISMLKTARRPPNKREQDADEKHLQRALQARAQQKTPDQPFGVRKASTAAPVDGSQLSCTAKDFRTDVPSTDERHNTSCRTNGVEITAQHMADPRLPSPDAQGSAVPMSCSPSASALATAPPPLRVAARSFPKLLRLKVKQPQQPADHTSSPPGGSASSDAMLRNSAAAAGSFSGGSLGLDLAAAAAAAADKSWDKTVLVPMPGRRAGDDTRLRLSPSCVSSRGQHSTKFTAKMESFYSDIICKTVEVVKADCSSHVAEITSSIMESFAAFKSCNPGSFGTTVATHYGMVQRQFSLDVGGASYPCLMYTQDLGKSLQQLLLSTPAAVREALVREAAKLMFGAVLAQSSPDLPLYIADHAFSTANLFVKAAEEDGSCIAGQGSASGVDRSSSTAGSSSSSVRFAGYTGCRIQQRGAPLQETTATPAGAAFSLPASGLHSHTSMSDLRQIPYVLAELVAKGSLTRQQATSWQSSATLTQEMQALQDELAADLQLFLLGQPSSAALQQRMKSCFSAGWTSEAFLQIRDFLVACLDASSTSSASQVLSAQVLLQHPWMGGVPAEWVAAQAAAAAGSNSWQQGPGQPGMSPDAMEWDADPAAAEDGHSSGVAVAGRAFMPSDSHHDVVAGQAAAMAVAGRRPGKGKENVGVNNGGGQGSQPAAQAAAAAGAGTSKEGQGNRSVRQSIRKKPGVQAHKRLKEDYLLP